MSRNRGGKREREREREKEREREREREKKKELIRCSDDVESTGRSANVIPL